MESSSRILRLRGPGPHAQGINPLKISHDQPHNRNSQGTLSCLYITRDGDARLPCFLWLWINDAEVARNCHCRISYTFDAMCNAISSSPISLSTQATTHRRAAPRGQAPLQECMQPREDRDEHSVYSSELAEELTWPQRLVHAFAGLAHHTGLCMHSLALRHWPRATGGMDGGVLIWCGCTPGDLMGWGCVREPPLVK